MLVSYNDVPFPRNSHFLRSESEMHEESQRGSHPCACPDGLPSVIGLLVACRRVGMTTRTPKVELHPKGETEPTHEPQNLKLLTATYILYIYIM